MWRRKSTKRKTWKWFGGRYETLWGSGGNGKYWKRKLNKSKRKDAKNKIWGWKRSKSVKGNRSTVNWRDT